MNFRESFNLLMKIIINNKKTKLNKKKPGKIYQTNQSTMGTQTTQVTQVTQATHAI